MLILSLVFNILFLQTEQDTSFRRIDESLTTQMSVYPQEKIHMHTDRDFYVPGEKIWFKAYVTDAGSHLFPTDSRYVYAELISPADTLVERVMIRPEDDMYHGYLPLSKNIPDGDYTLRAYTRYMENMGDDYFFKKNIRIGNLSSAKQQLSQTLQENRRESAERDDFDVSFFPEGGNLLEGVFCQVAFKAVNRNGYSETVSGTLLDENGVEITSTQTFHAGMGVFSFMPEPGKRYYLKCRNENGVEKQSELPRPNPRAYSLTATQRNNRMIVGVKRSVYAPDVPCYLLAHCRGTVLFYSEWDQKNEYLTFTEELFPAGVIQFVLFDGQMNPLSERLVFCKNYDAVKIELHTNKEAYQTRDKVVANISFIESRFNPLHGHFSVAITDDRDIAVDSSTTILSSLLLSSELKGYIENPGYYLRNTTESATALDYLMMTHGWRRYNIPEVAKGNIEYPQIPFQTTQEITGQVKSLMLSRPVTDSEITMVTKTGHLVGVTSTDVKGTFIYQDFEFPDSTGFLIQAFDKKGNSRVNLVVDNESFPALKYAPPDLFSEIFKNENTTGGEHAIVTFWEKAELRSKYDEDIRMYELSEVAITAKSPMINKEPRLFVFPLNEHSDVTLTREVFEKTHYRNIKDYLTSIPGVWARNEQIIIRNSTDIYGRPIPPLYLIDGIVVDSLEDVSIPSIESIDVFKGPSTAIFGSRGMGGVISVTLKRGASYNSSNKAEYNFEIYNPLGYQNPAEFYSPKYETLSEKQLPVPDLRTTIFWKPDLVISDEKEATFEFYTSGFRTTYSVVIEGMTTDGKIIREVKKIRVE